MQDQLFRAEALAHRSALVTGRVILRQPWALTIFTIVTAGLVLSVMVLACTQEYTRRTKVLGTLVPDKGLVKVYPMQLGRIVARHVAEGQQVTTGQLLFTLSTERQTQHGAISAQAVTTLVERKHSLQQDLATQDALFQSQQATLRQRMADLQLQLTQIQSAIANQKQRVTLAEATYARYQELARSNFAPPLQVQQRADELLAQQATLSGLQRNAQEIRGQLAVAGTELASLPLRRAQQKAETDRDIAALEQEILEREAQREVIVTAPTNGFVTAVQGEPGQAVTGDMALLSIVPKGSQLQAHFYAPSGAIGFIRPGQEVLLRYQAYPYQKFGQHPARIVSVSRSAVGPIGKDAAYRIVAKPASQTVMAYDRQEALLPDMQVEADVLVDKRKIIDWLLEPLIAIKQRI
ncbi:HlyD family secretion protein [Chitinimonas sp.]|uniref:HlyD family secretion protein n=1 Tax=Chitinimonas sp. TaxID=1934313 RepID=UPI002F93DCA6